MGGGGLVLVVLVSVVLALLLREGEIVVRARATTLARTCALSVIYSSNGTGLSAYA